MTRDSCRSGPALGWILPILSGVLLVLSYPPYDLEFLIWIAFIPLLFFIFAQKMSLKKTFIGGTLTGIIFFGKIFSWLFATYPFEWLGITAEKHNALIFIFLIVLYAIQTIFLSLFFGAFAWIVKKLVFSEKTGFWRLIIVPALWVIFEYLRAWGFGILWLGKESLIGPHWTFGNLAYALHNKLALIQIADIGGIYGISFLIVLVNIIFFLIFKFLKEKSAARKHLIILFVLLGLIATTWTGYGLYKLGVKEDQSKPEKVAILQTNFLSGSEFNPYSKQEVFKTILDLFQLASPTGGSSKESPDIIIAPEGFGIISLTDDQKIAKYLLKDFLQSGQIYLENKKIIDENGKTKSRLFYYDLEQEKLLGFYEKRLLVPNGDFLPYLTKAFLSLYSFNAKIESRLYQKGEQSNPVQTQKGNIGGTICSSIVSPEINRQMTKNGAEVLIVVSSDAPFHGNPNLLAQNLAMSKLRAVENRRYFAQATNLGYSFLLGPNGETIAKTSKFGNEILFSGIYLLDKKTTYTKLGDLIVVLSTILLGLTFILWYNKIR